MNKLYSLNIVSYYCTSCFFPSVTLFFFDAAHHKRNEMKYMTSIALRKLNPINKPSSPPVLAEINCFN